MGLLRFYSSIAPCRVLVLLAVVVCAGCWEKIEYTGPRPSTSKQEPTKAVAVTEPAKSPVGSTPASDDRYAVTSAESQVDSPPGAPSPPSTPPDSIPATTTESAPPAADIPKLKSDDDRYAVPPVAKATPANIPATIATPSSAAVVPDKVAAPPSVESGNHSADTTSVSATAVSNSVTTPVATPPTAAASPDATQTASTSSTPASPGTASPTTKTSAATTNTRLTAWILGSRLSLAALAHDRGVAAKSVPIWLEEARAAAKTLGSSLSELPEPAPVGDTAPASRQVINYLLLNGQSLGSELSQRRGPEESALFEIALKSNILLLLYNPSGTAGSSIAVAISRAAPQGKLPAELWRPLVELLQKERRQMTFRRRCGRCTSTSSSISRKLRSTAADECSGNQ